MVQPITSECHKQDKDGNMDWDIGPECNNATTLVVKDSISKVRHGKRFARIGASYISARPARIPDIP